MARFNHNEFRAGEYLKITVSGNYKSIRLDNYLCARFGNLSRAKMQRIIKAQDILVNSIKSKPSRKLRGGDVIEFYLPDRELVADDLPIDIIAEDDALVVVNKQPGIIIHPARGNPRATLLNALLHHATTNFSEKNQYKPMVVHRLDKETSGTVVFAKSPQYAQILAEQFASRETQKIYLALVHGKLPQKTGKIEEPLMQHPSAERQVVSENGKYALSLWDVIEEYEEFSLVKVILKTGRTHQIRCHLSHIGNPIVADTLYGGKKIKSTGQELQMSSSLDRVALHSWQLKFAHPVTNKDVEYISPLPKDIYSFCKTLENPKYSFDLKAL